MKKLRKTFFRFLFISFSCFSTPEIDEKPIIYEYFHEFLEDVALLEHLLLPKFLDENNQINFYLHAAKDPSFDYRCRLNYAHKALTYAKFYHSFTHELAILCIIGHLFAQISLMQESIFYFKQAITKSEGFYDYVSAFKISIYAFEAMIDKEAKQFFLNWAFDYAEKRHSEEMIAITLNKIT